VRLADDHAIVTEGLASLLQREFSLVGTVAGGARLIEAARQLRPDVIVTDVAMPGMGGLEALRRLKGDAISAKVIFLTMHADAQLAAEALSAGASGFVVKHAAGKELIAAIHAVLRGGTYVAPELASDVVKTLADGGASGAGPLTPRQREVASLIAAGRTMKEVAAVLGRSPRTVETHKYQIMAVIGAADHRRADSLRHRARTGRAPQPGVVGRHPPGAALPTRASGVFLTASVILRIAAGVVRYYLHRVDPTTAWWVRPDVVRGVHPRRRP
jgi:DNA-binding NarL/FixJ family response regulator